MASSGYFPSCRSGQRRNREKQFKNSPKTVFRRKQKISLKTVYQGDGSKQEISPETVSQWKWWKQKNRLKAETVSQWKWWKQKNRLKAVFRRFLKNREMPCFSLIEFESRPNGI
jgi:hypothetical protein